jgi:hypothetical protein
MQRIQNRNPCFPLCTASSVVTGTEKKVARKYSLNYDTNAEVELQI